MSEESITEPAGRIRGRWTLEQWILAGLFGGLTLAGVAISTGVAGTEVIAPPSGDATGVNVPLFVYLYATLGALGYIFTKVMVEFESLAETGGATELVSMAMRIPAAWVLGAGFYLVLVQGGSDPVANPHLFATAAFLVGLYVNVAIKSLGALADRMLGTDTSSERE